MNSVLVVDDDEGIREALTDVLQDYGYTVAQAGDGQDALGQARSRRPDLIVLDLMMPRMDGWEFRRQQERDPVLSAVPVVVVSAGRADGYPPATAHLQKPFDLDLFLAVVASAIQDGGPGRRGPNSDRSPAPPGPGLE